MTEQMREAFEAWVATTNGNYDYFDCYAQGYQAALSAVPAQEPTEEDLKFSSRTTWTFKDWYEHVGAWKTERDTLEFGSTIAFGAMMQQFAACLKWRLVNRQEPSIAKCSAIQKLGARLADLLDEDQFKECERLLLSIAQQPAQEPVRKQLETAVNRINDMLQNGDVQAHKEARKFIESLSSGHQPVVPSTPRYKISKCITGGYSVIEIKSLHTVCHTNIRWASDNKNKTTAERICLALNNLEKIK